MPTEALAGLSALVSLWLYNCAITELLPGAFASLTSLRHLELKWNLFPRISEGVFLGIANTLDYLNLGDATALAQVDDGAFTAALYALLRRVCAASAAPPPPRARGGGGGGGAGCSSPTVCTKFCITRFHMVPQVRVTDGHG